MKPNDGYCHLSGGGIYTEAENQVWVPVTFYTSTTQFCTLKHFNFHCRPPDKSA